MPHVNIKIESTLIEKIKQKQKAHPDTPAVYAVDQALRNYLEK